MRDMLCEKCKIILAVSSANGIVDIDLPSKLCESCKYIAVRDRQIFKTCGVDVIILDLIASSIDRQKFENWLKENR